MKKTFILAAVILSANFMTISSSAQSAYKASTSAEATPEKRVSLVDAQELGTAILKILAAAPKDFDPIRGALIDTGRSKGRYKGLVNMSSTNSPSVIPANGSYYVLSVLNNVEKSALSPSAVLTMKVIKRAMGEGTVEKEEPSKFSTIIYQYRNSNRTEWIEMVIHPFGHLTVFIYKK